MAVANPGGGKLPAEYTSCQIATVSNVQPTRRYIKIDIISYMNSNKDSPYINSKTELNNEKEDRGACSKNH